jgi:hypothetical protein
MEEEVSLALEEGGGSTMGHHSVIEISIKHDQDISDLHIPENWPLLCCSRRIICVHQVHSSTARRFFYKSICGGGIWKSLAFTRL